MYELKKKLERYLRVNLLGLGPRLMKKRIYWGVVSQRLRNTDLEFKVLHSPQTWKDLKDGDMLLQNDDNHLPSNKAILFFF
jgi:hypothetical protein